jgi:pimeloyl-ACP methyl ester carboxylesterase
VNHQGSLAVFPESEDTFVHKESGTRITFVKDASGRVTGLVLDRDGHRAEARRSSQTPAEDRTQTVVVGERQVRFLRTGAGQPTVILWSGIDAWSQIQHGLEKIAQAVSFDRVNTNATTAKPDFRTAGEAAQELHSALKSAHLPPPYVLVGHSFGGAMARVFANTYPKEVVGMVLVDPFQEEFLEWLRTHQPKNYDEFVSRGETYVSDWQETLSELRAASSFPDMPVALLTATNRKPQAGDAFEQGISLTDFEQGSAAIVNSHAEWISKISKGRLINVGGSSHNILLDRPEVVVQSIQEIIGEIKNSGR